MMRAEASSVPCSRYVRAFRDLPREHGYEPLRVVGTLPHALRGTLFATGPSLFSVFGQRYPHWFDGDGAVSAVRIGEGHAEGAVRVVDTAGLREERERGRPLFGGYSRSFDWPLYARSIHKRAKNAANTSMLVHGGGVFALWEGGKPTEIDPETLRARGESRLGGAVRTFSAHPARVAGRDVVYNFGTRIDLRTKLDLYSVDAAGESRVLATLPIAPTMIHDFVATERYLLFFVSPLRLDLVRSLVGLGGYDRNLRWRPERGTEVIVVPLEAPESPKRFRCVPFFQWHFANAYEEGDRLIVDLVRYPDFEINEWLREAYQGAPMRDAYGVLERAHVDLGREEVVLETLLDHPCEFPTIDPRRAGLRHRFVYVAAHRDRGAVREGLQDLLIKVDVERGERTPLDLGPNRYVGEARFVPSTDRDEEDAGWLLSHVYDSAAHATFVAVVDAKAMRLEAELWFDHHLPPRFHGDWQGGACGPT